LKHLLK